MIGSIVVKMNAVILKIIRCVHDAINVKELVFFFFSQPNHIAVNGTGQQIIVNPPLVGESIRGGAQEHLVVTRNVIFSNKNLVFPEKVIREILRVIGPEHEDEILMVTTDGFTESLSLGISIFRRVENRCTSLAIVVYLIGAPQQSLQS